MAEGMRDASVRPAPGRGARPCARHRGARPVAGRPGDRRPGVHRVGGAGGRPGAPLLRPDRELRRPLGRRPRRVAGEPGGLGGHRGGLLRRHRGRSAHGDRRPRRRSPHVVLVPGFGRRRRRHSRVPAHSHRDLGRRQQDRGGALLGAGRRRLPRPRAVAPLPAPGAGPLLDHRRPGNRRLCTAARGHRSLCWPRCDAASSAARSTLPTSLISSPPKPPTGSSPSTWSP